MHNRTIASIFLLFAGIIFLAHAVVPHHHHKEQVCIQNSHCDDDEAANNHEATDNEHEHDGDSSSSDCTLKQWVILVSHQNKRTCNVRLENYNHSPFFLTPSNNTTLDIVPKLLKGTYPSLATFNYSACVNPSTGLRAPPIC